MRERRCPRRAPRRRAAARPTRSRPARRLVEPQRARRARRSPTRAAAHARAAASSMRSVWSRVGHRARRRSSARRALRPARSIADFTCALATGSSISMPLQRAASHGRSSGAWPSVVSTVARPSGAAAPRSAPSAASVSDSSPRERRTRPPARRGHRRAGACSVPALRAVDRSPARQPAQADAAHDELVVGDVLDLDAERAHRVDRRLRVAGAAEAVDLASRRRASAPISTARCEIDLSPGTATCPTSATAGSTRIFNRWCVP